MRTRVFTTGSMWSLLIYLLYCSEEQIRQTKYFFNVSGIHPSVAHNFKCHTFDTNKWEKLPWKIRRTIQPFLRVFYLFRFPILFYADVYGIDQGIFCQSIIGWHKYTLIEDGIGDYLNDRKPKIRKHEKMKQLIFGKVSEHELGNNTQCKQIILTMPPTNDFLRKKGKQIDINELWRSSTSSKKKLILNLFNIKDEDVTIMKGKDILLLTQPLSEDGFISESTKVELYKQLLANIDENSVLIKTHPREKTDYAVHFPKAYYFNKKVPMQLFNLLGIKFNTVVTISSTAAYAFREDCNVIFAGNEIHPNILKAYGHADF